MMDKMWQTLVIYSKLLNLNSTQLHIQMIWLSYHTTHLPSKYNFINLESIVIGPKWTWVYPNVLSQAALIKLK
jgi:hypothetical protein